MKLVVNLGCRQVFLRSLEPAVTLIFDHIVSKCNGHFMSALGRTYEYMTMVICIYGAKALDNAI